MTSTRPHIHLISGEDPLLCQEARDALLKRATQTGFNQVERIAIDATNDWPSLPMQAQMQGLFGDKLCLDVQAAHAKFDKKAQQALQTLVTSYHPDTFIIIQCSKLTPAQKKTKWFQTLQKSIQMQFIWPLKPAEYPGWLQQRAKTQQVTLTKDALSLLAQLTMGNLLAGHQALAKLSLAFPAMTIEAKQIMQAMSDSARYSIFDLTDAALLGQTQQTIQILSHLQETNQEPVLILWALTKEIRELWELLSAGSGMSQRLNKQWATRKTLLQAAIRRHHTGSLANLLHLAHMTDCQIKGVDNGNHWVSLSQLSIGLSQGHRP